MNSNAVNNALSNEAVLVANRLNGRMPDLGLLSAKILVERAVQKVLELGRLPYAKLALDGSLKDGTPVDLGRCVLESGTGRISLTKKQWILGVTEFLVHWCYCLVSLLAVRITTRQKQGVVLAFGISTESIFVDGGRDTEFAEYCRQTPVVPLRDAKYLYIQSMVPSCISSDSRITYIPRPLIELVRRGSLGAVARMQALAAHVLGLYEFLWAAVRCAEVTLLGRDCAYVKVVAALDANHLLEAVVTTCSSVAEQPLWGRCLGNAKVHMVWYAQNWRPIAYAIDELDSGIPFLRWIRVDVHWVWTLAFAQYINAVNIGKQKVHAVGPIVWRIPHKLDSSRYALVVTMFDIPPYGDEVAKCLCEWPNYNNLINIIKFIDDVASIFDELKQKYKKELRLQLKVKRDYNNEYELRYFEYISEMRSGNRITLINGAANIYEVVGESDLCIAYPFTSPLYIADSLGIPSIYYDPTGKIIRGDFPDSESNIYFASDMNSLMNQIESLLDAISVRRASLG